MNAIEIVIQKIKMFEIGISESIRQAIKENEQEIKDFQTKGQLFEGINSLGQKIIPKYKARTIAIKEKKGQPTNRVTLKDTGTFYNSQKIKADKKSLKTTFTDDKTADLKEKYGDEIIGLTREYREILLEEIILPKLKNDYDTITKS